MVFGVTLQDLHPPHEATANHGGREAEGMTAVKLVWAIQEKNGDLRNWWRTTRKETIRVCEASESATWNFCEVRLRLRLVQISIYIHSPTPRESGKEQV